MSKIISIIGPQESGKTTVAVCMSEILAEKGYNVCVVCCDKTVPTVSVLMPQSVNKTGDTSDKIHSIGKVLNYLEFSEDDILRQCTYSKKYKRIIFMGYAYGENENTYPEPTDFDVYSFYGKLSKMVDYIIVDCTPRLSEPLCKVAVENSDCVIRLVGGKYKDISYYASNNPIIPEGKIKKDKHIVVASKVQKKDDIDYLSSFYDGIDYKLPYSDAIVNMFNFGEYLIKNFPSSYMKVIKKIIDEADFS